MAKIKKRRLCWVPSPSPQVVGYRLYWSVKGAVDYNSNCVNLGNVSEIILPDDVGAFAELDGPVEVGVAAVDEVGNESDLVILKIPYQFAIPQAPSDLRLETLRSIPADALAAAAPETYRRGGLGLVGPLQERSEFQERSAGRREDGAVRRLEELRSSAFFQTTRRSTEEV